MSKFTLQQGAFTSYTSIPNCFIEQFMPYAAGEFVKIYIYLLKCVNENQSELSISKIADAFNNTEKDVVRALKYWQKKGLLDLTFDEDNSLKALQFVPFSDIMENSREAENDSVTLCVTDAPVPGNPANNVKHGKTASERRAEAASAVNVDDTVKQPAKKEYTKAEIAAFSKKDDVMELLFIVERYLGRPLGPTDINTVLFMNDTLGFSTDLIEYLFEYCVGKEHRSMRYIEKTGIAWAEQGIKTVAAAKTMSTIYSDDCRKVLNAFGIVNRMPTQNESDFVTRWTISYGFDIQIVLAACSRTMDRIHQPNFEYTDGILNNWKGKSVKTVDDIKKLDLEFENAAGRRAKPAKQRPANKAAGSMFNNFQQREYNFTELEEKLINQ